MRREERIGRVEEDDQARQGSRAAEEVQLAK